MFAGDPCKYRHQKGVLKPESATSVESVGFQEIIA